MNGDVMEFAALRERGIQLIQRLADAGWTDHNAHDPGITILEQVCYALTDLGYRTEYGVADLLAGSGDAATASLYTPAAILPSGAVTLTDLRKLVIDVPGVKNAWIEIVDKPLAAYDAALAEVSYLPVSGDGGAAFTGSPNVSEVRPRGLYRVQIEKSDVLDIDGGEIRRQAARRLHRFRGLGEDYASIAVLEFQPLDLDATLEIRPTGDPIELLANVYRRIAEYCSPPVRFYTLAEMLDRGFRVDEIFEGPLLDHGFIDARELEQAGRRTSLRISDLIRELTAVPGVAAVKNLHFLTPTGTRSRDWLLTLDPARAPWFDPRRSSIRLERGNLRVDSEALAEAARRVFVERSRPAARAVRTAASDRDLQPVPGRDRSVGHYHSLQYEFPMVYGVGPAGLSQTAPPERRAQAKQLKAYLMLYDQLLANHFAQLAGVGRLFSFHDETPDSYFSQAVQEDDAGALALHEIRDGGAPHDAVLRRITEDPSGEHKPGGEPGIRRRSRLLDHLLARVGEQFSDYSVLQLGLTAGGEPAAAVRVAEDKRAFLRDYPRIGRDRGVGFNVLDPAPEGSGEFLPGDCTNPAGLRGKLTAAAPDPVSAFLGTQLEADERYVLNDPNATRDGTNAALQDLLNRIVNAGSSIHDDDRFAGVALSSETLRLLRQRPAVSGLDLVRLNRLLLEDAYPGEIARSRDEDNLGGLELALRRKLGIRDREERFHLVEHILLRPLAGDKDQHGPLFRAANVRDPYSLQLTFVFPSWPARYQNPHFRQFVEETVRDQIPAHLTAYVRWLERPAMAAFEAAFAGWLHRWRNHRRADLGL